MRYRRITFLLRDAGSGLAPPDFFCACASLSLHGVAFQLAASPQ